MNKLNAIPKAHRIPPPSNLPAEESVVDRSSIIVSDTIPDRFPFIKNTSLLEPIVVIRNPASGDKKFLAARLPDECDPKVKIILFPTVGPNDLFLLTHFRAKAVRRPSTIASIDIIDYFMSKRRNDSSIRLISQYSDVHFRENRLVSKFLSDPVKEELRRRDREGEPTMTQQGLIHLRCFPKVNQLDVLNLVMPHHGNCFEQKLVRKMVLFSGIKTKMGRAYTQPESPVELPTAEEVARMARETRT